MSLLSVIFVSIQASHFSAANQAVSLLRAQL